MVNISIFQGLYNLLNIFNNYSSKLFSSWEKSYLSKRLISLMYWLGPCILPVILFRWYMHLIMWLFSFLMYGYIITICSLWLIVSIGLILFLAVLQGLWDLSSLTPQKHWVLATGLPGNSQWTSLLLTPYSLTSCDEFLKTKLLIHVKDFQ